MYFYHCSHSSLPIRDVVKECRPEPHIEIGAENYLSKCYRQNIKLLLSRRMKYVFLVTMCNNRTLKRFYKRRYVVGYILVRQKGWHKDHYFVKGETKIFPFEEAYPLRDLFNRLDPQKMRFFYSRRILNKTATARLIEFFRGRRSILEKCIEEIKNRDPNNKTCHYAQDPGKCMFFQECLRFKE